MKYIRKAKNTKMAGKMPDEFVTEHIDEVLFNKKHEAMGGWEKVSNAKCKELCDANDQLMKDWTADKDNSIQEARRAKQIIQKKEHDALKAEFNAFKIWKASQE